MNNHLFKIIILKFLFLLAISLWNCSFLAAQGVLENLIQKDPRAISYIKTEKSRFFPEADQIFATHFYSLIVSGKGLYAWVDATGRLYKANSFDTGIAFIRQDSTTHFGYNIAAFPFSYQGKIYTLGGYGLWRINGQLRVYDENEKQWDIVKLNEEVPLMFDGDNNLLWYTPSASSIYLGSALYRNEAIGQNENEIDETRYDYKVHRLDLQKFHWETIGDLNEILRNKPISTIAMSPWGQLILAGDKINLIDFVRNKILVLDVNKQSYQSIVRNRYSCTFYFRDSTLFYGNIRSMKLDSIPMKYADFYPTGQAVYTPKAYKTYLRIILFALSGGVSFLLLWGISKRYKLTITNKRKNKTEHKASIESNISFDEKELQLLELLVRNSQENQFTGLDEINTVLGIGKRSLEIQKKQRSDIITSINKKYSQSYPGQETLISKQRADFDKRSFEYFIDSSKIEVIKSILNT